MKKFTMVEIVLAIMVAAVGVIGVMALMPIGLSKNKDTVYQRTAADAADQFLHQTAAKIRSNWKVHNAFPEVKNEQLSEDEIYWSEEDYLIESKATRIQFSAINVTDEFDPEVHQHGIFRVTHVTLNNDKSLDDFVGVIKAWKEITIDGDQRLNGDIMPWGVVQFNDDIGRGFMYGEQYTLKYNSGGQVSSGNFGCVNFSGGGGGGAAQYQNHIENGGIEASVGDEYYPNTGNMVGPTIAGLETRLENSPYVLIPVVTEFGNGGI